MKSQPIRIENLTFGYGSKLLFRDFSVALTGDFNVLRGPSGCGKTTLLKLCGGFLDTGHPKTVLGMSSRPILILQEDGLWPWLTGLDNIKHILQVSDEEVTSSPLYGLIEPFVLQKAFQLSFGQRRLIELVRAFLAPGSNILMLDEPFNFLDRQKREILIQYLVRRSSDTKIIMTSHYLENVAARAVKVYEFVGDAPYETLSESSKEEL